MKKALYKNDMKGATMKNKKHPLNRKQFFKLSRKKQC